ncbi:MAG: hypothetical protein IPO90_12230 [Flavobacteriales bacterium]|nr:hypothetical protein [Flavobacteriales bacterium]
MAAAREAGAKEARNAEEVLTKAKKEGKVKAEQPVTVESLTDAGMNRDEAEKANTAWNVYNAAKVQAQSADVLNGFGNNGGEEFLSFLQRG